METTKSACCNQLAIDFIEFDPIEQSHRSERSTRSLCSTTSLFRFATQHKLVLAMSDIQLHYTKQFKQEISQVNQLLLHEMTIEIGWLDHTILSYSNLKISTHSASCLFAYMCERRKCVQLSMRVYRKIYSQVATFPIAIAHLKFIRNSTFDAIRSQARTQ